MRSLKTKASRFFGNCPSQDEKVAHAESSAGVDFDAGIQERSLRKKPSRFFQRRDKPLPAPPSNASSSTLAAPSPVKSEEHAACEDNRPSPENASAASDGSLPFPPAPVELEGSLEPIGAVKSARSSTKLEADAPRLKPRPSFATLRSKGSRLFRTNNADPQLLPPPVPQLPVLAPPKSRNSSVTPLSSARNSRTSLGKCQGRIVSISRPTPLPYFNAPMPACPATFPFTKRAGPPPVRPARPDSLDEDIIAFMKDSGTRMVLPGSNRASNSTASASTPRSHASSVEARLGFPTGHGTPYNYSLDSPLAARFPTDILQPLQVRDSTGSVKISRFSEYLKANQHGGYASDGVDAEDRDVGPIEQYDASKEGEWTLEKRISRGSGHPGMLFRDKHAGFHFVADI